MKKLISLLAMACISFAVTASPSQPPNVSVCQVQKQNTIELACVSHIEAVELTIYKTFITDDTVVAQTTPVMEVVFAPPVKIESKLYSSIYNTPKNFIPYGLRCRILGARGRFDSALILNF